MRRVIVALAVAVVIGVALTLVRPAPTTENAAVVNPPDAAVDPAPYLAAFPLTPLEAPPTTGQADVDRARERALVPYRAGDYHAAASALDGVLLDHPDDARTRVFLGVARLLTDEPQNALELLRGMPGDATPELAGEAAWFTLVGIARLRDPSHVEPEARVLCGSGLPTAARACAALERLAEARAARR